MPGRLRRGSWLGCRDCQPWEHYIVQGPASHSRSRPMDIPGTHFRYSTMQLLIIIIIIIIIIITIISYLLHGYSGVWPLYHHNLPSAPLPWRPHGHSLIGICSMRKRLQKKMYEILWGIEVCSQNLSKIAMKTTNHLKTSTLFSRISWKHLSKSLR